MVWITIARSMSRLDFLNMVDLYWVFILKYLFWIHLSEEFMYFVLNLKIITGKKFNILQYVWLLLKIPNQPRNYTFISKTIRNDRVKKLKNFVRRHLEFCNLFLWRPKEIRNYELHENDCCGIVQIYQNSHWIFVERSVTVDT